MDGSEHIDAAGTMTSAKQTLEAVSSELDRTDVYLTRLEDVLVALIQTTEFEVTPEQKSTLQEIDLLSQTLQGLSKYLISLASELGDETKVNIGPAIAALSLAAMKKRLDKSADLNEIGEEISGKVDMF
ncbi:MAG: hypothetical protein AAGA12_05060 [Pseudomonadota bacterium]